MWEDENSKIIEDESSERKKKRYTPGIFFQIIKWLGIIIGVIIFIVTITVITLNLLERNERLSQTRIPDTEEYQYSAQPPVLDWFSNVGELRGNTEDDINKTFIVVPHLGYDVEDRVLQNELIARTIQIREIITFYFSSHMAEELRGVENIQQVKAELTVDINRILRNGKIRDVAFDRYQVVDF